MTKKTKNIIDNLTWCANNCTVGAFSTMLSNAITFPEYNQILQAIVGRTSRIYVTNNWDDVVNAAINYYKK